MSFLRPLKSFDGMFQRLFGMLATGLMIFFLVVRSSNPVGVCCEIVEFGSPLVRVIWHSHCLPRHSVHDKPILFFKVCNIEHPASRPF